jgi:hypothetical protein
MNMGSNGHSEVLAQESHSGRIWSLLIVPTILAPAISVLLYPAASARGALLVIGAIGVGVLLMTWGGFQYRFLRDGVEIRMLGFRLRSIPRQAIVSYSAEPWTFLRGYGIRGIGSTRAYVWGNKVVHIRMSNGEVFLGHRDPEQIIRDLDMVTGFVTRG